MKHRRIVVSRHGGPAVLELIEDELPEPGAGEVRVKVQTAGVAWGDILLRSVRGLGVRLPYTPGYDIVGSVDKLGDGVSGIEPGATVAALPLKGGYAEFICLPHEKLVQVPAGVDPADAVCLAMNYVVAYQMLHRVGRAQAGERLLVHGAAGGVGTASLQLGKLAELEMYGTTSGAKRHIVQGLGGTPIDYREEDFAERVSALGGVDIVFEPFGGTHVGRSYGTLRRGGRLVSLGFHAIRSEGKLKSLSGLLLLTARKLVPDGRRSFLYSIGRPKYGGAEPYREDLTLLFSLLSQRRIEPIIAQRMPLVEAPRAHALLEEGSTVGKIVLVCSA